MMGEKSELGANKYLNNLLGFTNSPKPLATSTSNTRPFLAQSLTQKIESDKNYASKPKLLREFPLGITPNLSQPAKKPLTKMPSLFPITEKVRETDKLLVFPRDPEIIKKEEPSDKSDRVYKVLTFDDEEDKTKKKISFETSEDLQSPLIQDFYPGIMEEEYQTPTKDSPNGFNFFNTVTAKKEGRSKFYEESNKKNGLWTDSKVNGWKMEEKEPQITNRSRFEKDYEVLEVILKIKRTRIDKEF